MNSISKRLSIFTNAKYLMFRNKTSLLTITNSKFTDAFKSKENAEEKFFFDKQESIILLFKFQYKKENAIKKLIKKMQEIQEVSSDEESNPDHFMDKQRLRVKLLFLN